MAEIQVNPNDLESIVKSYKEVNNTFVLRSFVIKDNQKICDCFINGKECKIIFYIKKNSIRICPTGKNIDKTNLLVKYVESKGFSIDIATEQFVFNCSKDIIDSLLNYIKEECTGIVTYNKTGNLVKFKGYNGDIVTLNFYPTKNKAMIQGRPFHAFSIIVTYLSSLPEYTFEQIIEINNSFAGMNTPSSSIRCEMKNKLGDAYHYLDEALKKSISGSLSLLKQENSYEDYTGCITGEFKALEGYLKKILNVKYGYHIDKKNAFGMFYKESKRPSMIDTNANIDKDKKEQLIRLNNLYSSKRNVYLHSTVDPSQTRIISTLREARDLSDEILKAIKESYNIIFS